MKKVMKYCTLISLGALSAFMISSCSWFKSKEKPVIVKINEDKQDAPFRQLSKKEKAEETALVKMKMALEYKRQSDIKSALESAKGATKDDPKNPDTWRILAYIQQEANLVDEADQSYQQALGIASNDPNVNNSYGNFLCHYRKAYLQSMPYFDRAIADPIFRNPDKAYLNKAVCYGLAGQYNEANSYFAKALTFNPNNPGVYTARADMLLRQGRAAEAQLQFEKAQKMTNSMGPEDLYIGWKIARALGDNQMAFEYEALLRKNYPLSDAMKRILQNVH